LREQILDLDLLDLYSKLSRESYIQQRTLHDSRRIAGKVYRPSKRWDGGKDRSTGRVHQPIWPKVGRFMLENRLDPETSAAALFATVCNTDKQAYPPQLHSENYLDTYKLACNARESSIRHRFNADVQSARTKIIKAEMMGLNKREACSLVLLDKQSGLSSLFRLCLAFSEGMDDVWPKFVASSVVQYLSSPAAHDKIWGNWLPPGFAKACRESRKLATGVKQKGRRPNASKGKPKKN
jgi:hypothetical protein